MVGEFSLTITNKHLENLLDLFSVKMPHSITNRFSVHESFLYLIITNQDSLSSNSSTYEVGISDLNHHIVSTMSNKQYRKVNKKSVTTWAFTF